MFQKGKSGNPSGRPKDTDEKRAFTQACQGHSKEALTTLLEVMRNKKAPAAARVKASETILDRGWGKAPQTLTVEDERDVTIFDFDKLTPEQIVAFQGILSVLNGSDASLAGVGAGSHPAGTSKTQH